MAKSWAEVEQSDAFKKLPLEKQSDAKIQYWKEVVVPKSDFQSLTSSQQIEARNQFFSKERNLTSSEIPESIGRKIYRETLAPIAEGTSTFAFGIPRLEARYTGSENEIYPEQKTLFGKVLRGGAETVGFIGGGVGKTAAKIGGKLIPTLTKEAIEAGVKEGLGKRMFRGGVEGAVSGALLPTKEGIINPKERLQTGATLGVIGGSIPMVGKGLEGTKQVWNKSGRWIAKNIGGITDATVDTIKRLGADRVFDPLKAKADYIVQDLMPRMTEKFNQAVSSFNPSIQKFAEEKLNIPASSINTVKKMGVDRVNQIRQSLGDSTDTIYSKIEQGFENKKDLADKVYQKAVDNVPKGFGRTIDIRDTVGTMRNVFKGSLGEATRGPQGNRLLNIMKELESRMPSQNGFYGEKLPTDTEIVRHLRGENLSNISNEVRINLKQYMELRDALNSLYRENPYDRNIAKVMDKFYADGEKSGLKGLQEARTLQREAFEAEKNLNVKSLINEKKLDKFQSMTKEDIRKLKDIENYTGVKFVDDLDALTASRHLDKLKTFNSESFAKDMIKARNPEWTANIKAKYENILGKDNVKDVWDDLMAHFANRDFDLVTQTPGTGGGMYPSRSGLIRGAVAGATKQYYKSVKPTINQGKNLVDRVASPIKKLVINKKD